MYRQALASRFAIKSNQRGLILPVVLGFIFIFSMVIGGMLAYAGGTMKLINRERNQIQAFYMAEAASEKALAQIQHFFQNNAQVPDLATITMPDGGAYFGLTPNITFTDAGNWVAAQPLTSGDYAGLNGVIRTIDINVTATNNRVNPPVSVTLTQSAEIQLIPIFQFGVFYAEDLEILPGANMTFAGPVHTNGNLYLGAEAGKSLTFDSNITAHGDILHDRKNAPGTVMPGNVFVEDDTNTDQNMYQGSQWLDSTVPTWATDASDRWDGNVADAAHDVKSLNLPLPVDFGNRTLIERRSGSDTTVEQQQKMDYKAHLRIIDGAIMNQAGATVDVRYCKNNTTSVISNGNIVTNGTPTNYNDDSCPSGWTLNKPVTSTTFYNHREAKTIYSTDVDIAKLNDSPSFKAIADATTGVILYSSDTRNSAFSSRQDALRLVNGSTLYKSMTVVSENPLYIKGNYNSTSKKAAGIISDAFNILSGSWNDSNSTLSLSNRIASNTTVQAAVITGNTDTAVGQYNGGFENYSRLLEDWGGRTLTYKGSVIILYNSEKAVGNWVYGAPYYGAPTRSWSFDTDFSNPNYSIPGFPSVFTIVKSDWSISD